MSSGVQVYEARLAAVKRVTCNKFSMKIRAGSRKIIPMISGAHMILYSKDAEADRAFLRDVLRFPHVDVGHGWLIFALPPSEIAVHPDVENGKHEIYLMCDDVEATIADLTGRGVACSPVHEERWGSITQVTLPGGGKIGIYQPKHPLAPRS